MTQKKRIVLAYSGGLDTSIILKWLQENYNAEIICYTANIGQEIDKKKIIKNAKKFGVKNIIIKDDRIDSVNFEDIDFEADLEINANNTILSPGFIDSHTHLIFASNRADDFSKRISGQSYIDIANSGGGIKSSINSFRKTSEKEILKDCEKKISYFLRNGTTTIEVKSGYGLSLEDELKSLTNKAFQNDVFGAPTFIVNNKLFWGQDRLEYALEECVS